MRDSVFLATKVSAQNLRMKICCGRRMRACVGLASVTLISIKFIHPNPEIPIEETMGAMEQLVDAGKSPLYWGQQFLAWNSSMRRAGRLVSIPSFRIKSVIIWLIEQ